MHATTRRREKRDNEERAVEALGERGVPRARRDQPRHRIHATRRHCANVVVVVVVDLRRCESRVSISTELFLAIPRAPARCYRNQRRIDVTTATRSNLGILLVWFGYLANHCARERQRERHKHPLNVASNAAAAAAAAATAESRC